MIIYQIHLDFYKYALQCSFPQLPQEQKLSAIIACNSFYPLNLHLIFSKYAQVAKFCSLNDVLNYLYPSFLGFFMLLSEYDIMKCLFSNSSILSHGYFSQLLRLTDFLYKLWNSLFARFLTACALKMFL